MALENPITSDDLTIDFSTLLDLSVSDRVQAAASDNTFAQALMASLTPIQMAKAFPDYYRRQLPDISNFILANRYLDETGKGAFDQQGGGDPGEDKAFYDGETAVPAGQNPAGVPEVTAEQMREKLLEKGIDVGGTLDFIGTEGKLLSDPKLTHLNNLTPEQMSKAGLEVSATDEGKKVIRTTAIPEMTDEQAVASMREQAAKAQTGVVAPGSLADTLQSGEVFGSVKAAGKAYQSYNKGAAHGYKAGTMDLEKTPLSEVMRLQNLPKNHPDKLFAVGAYQVIPDTMKAAVTALGLDPDKTTYDAATQTKIMAWLTTEKPGRKGIGDFIRGDSDDILKAQEQMSQEWASMASVSKGGKSYYSDGVNKAKISLEQTRASLEDAKKRYKENITLGMDPQTAYESALTGVTSQAVDPEKQFTPEEISKHKVEVAEKKKLDRENSLVESVYDKKVSPTSIEANPTPATVSSKDEKLFLSDTASTLGSIDDKANADRPNWTPGEIQFQGLDKKFKAGSGGRKKDNPSTPYGVYKLPGMSAPGPKLGSKFAAMRGPGNTEIINIPDRYDSKLGRTRTEMQFHPAIAPKDMNGDDVADLLSSGCIAVDPAEYDEFMETYKQFYKDNNGEVYLSVIPGPPGEPAQFRITNKKPENADIITPDKAIANHEETGTVAPDSLVANIDNMDDGQKTRLYGSPEKAENIKQDIRFEKNEAQKSQPDNTTDTQTTPEDRNAISASPTAKLIDVKPNTVRPDLPGGETAMANKEDIKGVIFHKPGLSLEELKSGGDPRDDSFGYNTAIVSTYIDESGNSISEQEWKKLPKSQKKAYTEKAEVHQLRPEDVRPNQMKPSDNPARTDVGRELNNTNALGIVTIGQDSPAKQEASQKYLAQLIADGKMTPEALSSVYGHGETQPDEGRGSMDPGKAPEGSVAANAVRINTDKIIAMAEDLKQKRADQFVQTAEATPTATAPEPIVYDGRRELFQTPEASEAAVDEQPAIAKLSKPSVIPPGTNKHQADMGNATSGGPFASAEEAPEPIVYDGRRELFQGSPTAEAPTVQTPKAEAPAPIKSAEATPAPVQVTEAIPAPTGRPEEVRKFRTGGSPDVQDDENLSVFDEDGSLKWKMNSGEGIYVKPKDTEYADDKIDELAGRVDDIDQRNDTPEKNQPKAAPDKAHGRPEKNWQQNASSVTYSIGSQGRAFKRTKFQNEGFHFNRSAPNSTSS